MSDMITALRILLSLLVFFILLICHIISSFVYLFIPRILRRKKNIKGQRVLITGAGSGVGRELAIEFSKHATCLILVDINKQSLLQTEKLLDRSSPVFIYECDVSDYEKVYEMADKVKKEAGDVNILVNNAGIVSGNFLWDLPEKKIVKTMEVNALAHFWTCKAFLPAMMEKNEGHIVSIISLACRSGGPRVSDYCASKFAAMGFAESLEMELRLKKLDGIKVTMVCPTVIDSGLFKGVDIKGSPVLTPSYVAQETVAGVLEDKELIFLPSYFKFFFILKDLSPRWIVFLSNKISGNIYMMDNFTGRVQTDNGLETRDTTKKLE